MRNLCEHCEPGQGYTLQLLQAVSTALHSHSQERDELPWVRGCGDGAPPSPDLCSKF